MRPNRRHNIEKNSRYSVIVDFTGEDKFLVRSFKFVPKLPGITGNQFIANKIWEQLSVEYHHYGIVSPDLSSDLVMCINTVSLCQHSRSVSWHQSSILFTKAIHRYSPR